MCRLIVRDWGYAQLPKYLSLLCFVLSFTSCTSSPPNNSSGTIETIAGTGEPGFLGDDGPAKEAMLERPFGIAIDEIGNVYIGEAARIRKIDTRGQITTIAGSGVRGFSGDGVPASIAEVNLPQLSFDGDGNLWVLNSFQPILRKIDQDGVITVIAGTGLESSELGDGDIAKEVDLCGVPHGPAIDKDGNAYISCELGHVILQIDTDGIVHRFAGTGEPGFSGDGGPAKDAQLFLPLGIDTDSDGNLYIADSANSRIRKIDPSGIISTVAGNGTSGFAGDGGLAVEAALSTPFSIAIDSDGAVYFASYSNRVIRKIDSNGLIHTVVGGGGVGSDIDGVSSTTTSFKGPSLGLAIDGNGNLFITDDVDNRVRRVTFHSFEA
jgi:sugar lactone lactonase YvrE